MFTRSYTKISRSYTKNFYFGLPFLFFSFVTTAQTVTDIDGNIYQTVSLGTQTWMKENLKVTRFNDGSPIPRVTDGMAWEQLVAPAYCWYRNDTANGEIYGALYNWYAIGSGKLAPEGWRCPTAEDWNTLANFLGGDSIAGGRMKEAGFSHWLDPNTGATNSSGFTALPGGVRDEFGTFDYLGYIGGWWCSTESDTSAAAYFAMFNNYAFLLKLGQNKVLGGSVRLMKDNGSGTGGENSRQGFRLFPNPSAGHVSIVAPAGFLPAEITIYNLTGTAVIQRPFQNILDIGPLPAGIYMLELSDGKNYWRKKLIRIE